jgi:hypothetical protein
MTLRSRSHRWRAQFDVPNNVLVREMKPKLRRAMAIGLGVALLSMGSIALVFAGFKAFRQVTYIVMPPGATLVMHCSVLAALAVLLRRYR